MSESEQIVHLIEDLIVGAEFHYYHSDEEKYMDGYLDALKVAKEQIAKKFLTIDESQV